MGQHSIADAKNHFSELIGRAEKGEEIVITRHGKVVAKIVGDVAKNATPKRITKEAIEWLDRHRVGKMPKEDAGTLVSRMRDEDWQR